MNSPRSVAQRTVLLAAAAVLFAGCQVGDQTAPARRFERYGQAHVAYEKYRGILQEHPGHADAQEGMKRTASAAAAYWLSRAREAEREGDWLAACRLHFKVLQIRPDVPASLEALRRLRRDQADAYAQALRDVRADELPGRVLAMLPPEDLRELLEEGYRPPRHAAAQTDPAPLPAGMQAPVPPAAIETPAGIERSAATDTPRGDPAAAAASPMPVPQAQTASTAAAPPAAETPEPVNQPAEPDEAPEPLPAVHPRLQVPSVYADDGSSNWVLRKIIHLSRDDDRYPKRERIADGLVVKLRDTDPRPLDADLEIELGGHRIGVFEDVPPRTVIRVYDINGHQCEIVLYGIYDPDETVTIGLRRP
jgi:hypothetical protein